MRLLILVSGGCSGRLAETMLSSVPAWRGIVPDAVVLLQVP
jgi:hypothetical protein